MFKGSCKIKIENIFRIINNKVMDKLHIFQKEIVDECIIKGGGGISLPMGCGKTLISLIIALKQVNDENGEILIVVIAIIYEKLSINLIRLA